VVCGTGYYGGRVRLARAYIEVWQYSCSSIHRQNFEFQQMPLDSKQEGVAFRGLSQYLVELLNWGPRKNALEN
jgi:hypothetical protein